MIYYTLEGLYTAISKTDLENLLSDRSKADARKHIIFCLEKAKEIALEILGTSAERVLAKNLKIAPGTVRECIEVQAAVFLMTNSDMGELKKLLNSRLSDAKKMLENLRNSTVSPSKQRNRIKFGESEF
jgi:hypothetical protein